MATCWILYDRSDAHTYTLQRFVEQGEAQGMKTTIQNVNDLAVTFSASITFTAQGTAVRPSIVYSRLGAMRATPHAMLILGALAAAGIPVVNGLDATARAADKLVTAQCLAAAGVAQPRTALLTLAAPSVESVGGYPCVLKAARGSQGDGVMLVENEDRLLEIAGLLKGGSAQQLFLVQEFIKASMGSDVRVWVVGGKAVAAMRRRAAKGFRANVHQGGMATNETLDDKLVQIATDAVKALGLDVAGVDVLQRQDGSFVVCEINAAAGIEAFEKATNADVATPVMAYVRSKIL